MNASSSSAASPALAAGASLDLLANAVASLDPAAYAVQGEKGIAGAVGGHVRHCLDHASAALASLNTGVVDYEARSRGSNVEQDPAQGVAELRQAAQKLRACPPEAMQRTVRVRTRVSAEADWVEAPTSLARELIFVQSHTIHHSAMVAALLREHGVTPPAELGFAPSTLWNLSPA
ncbi:MAG: DinB family protein [Planctomycetota bacterium]